MVARTENLDVLRSKVLAAALQLAPKQGVDEALLGAAVAKAGYPPSYAALLFVGGLDDLLVLWHTQMDEKFLALAPARLKKIRRVRDKIREAVWLRLAQDKPHRAFARAVVVRVSEPSGFMQAPKQLFCTADIIWRAVGDTSLDIAYYSKRAILAGIYAATYMVWVRDMTRGQARSKAFLRARIDDVMQFEEAKTQLGRWAKTIEARAPDVLGQLARWRFEGKPMSPMSKSSRGATTQR